jgi:hypothetical protein
LWGKNATSITSRLHITHESPEFLSLLPTIPAFRLVTPTFFCQLQSVMSSAVHNLQKVILAGNQSLTQLLRQTKLIAAKLGLEDVEAWVDLELNGYSNEVEPPQYREFGTQTIEIRNPVRGWEFAGHFHQKMTARQPIADIEHLSKGETLTLALTRNLPVEDGLVT